MHEKYLLDFHKNDLIDILKDEDTSKYFSININFIVLYETQQELGLELLDNPDSALEQWDRAVLRAQLKILKEVNANCQLKNNVHCRIYQLATCSQFYGKAFPGIKDVGKFVQLSGTVMRISTAKLLEYQRTYICVKCKTNVIVKAEYERMYMIEEPKKCSNPEGCPGGNLIHLGEKESDSCKDYQEIKIQENVKDIGMRALHNIMLVTLEDDLVDNCQPGDNVTICGIVKKRWQEVNKGHKLEYSLEITLKANYLQVDNKSFKAAPTPETKHMFNSFWENHSDDVLLGRDIILKSICPQLYGLYLVKLAVAIVIAGGTQIEDKTHTGVRTRSESHLLLVGDPGTGKSQLLKFITKIVPRSVLTTGVGSTSAGLTCTAVMEQGVWHLEAGALVMSDGGICCIDEFNSMKERDRTSIHEAMEQQTISVAKASLVCKLNTRCSIVAACNPKGNIDPSQPICMSIALPSPLLSRFDLVLILRDIVNEEWDSLVADWRLYGEKNSSQFSKSQLWNIEELQSYFRTIKKFLPMLTEEAEIILNSYYQRMRQVESRSKARTTVRLLESLVRLSQGHSRLMYHDKVEVIDAVHAVILVDSATERINSILNLNINTLSPFPERPGLEYRNMLVIVLEKLGLHETLEKELESLGKVQGNVQSRFFQNNDSNKRKLECNDDDDDTLNNSSIAHTDADTINSSTVDNSASGRQLDVRQQEHKAVEITHGVSEMSVNNQENSVSTVSNPQVKIKAARGEVTESDKFNLNKFKRRRKDMTVSNQTKTDELPKDIPSTGTNCTKTKGNKWKKASKPANFMDDLKAINMLPSVNDDFHIDLDFDWDNPQNDLLSSTKIMSQELDIGSNRQPSSVSQGDSSLSQTKRMFEEEVDEADFDI